MKKTLVIAAVFAMLPGFALALEFLPEPPVVSEPLEVVEPGVSCSPVVPQDLCGPAPAPAPVAAPVPAAPKANCAPVVPRDPCAPVAAPAPAAPRVNCAPAVPRDPCVPAIPRDPCAPAPAAPAPTEPDVCGPDGTLLQPAAAMTAVASAPDGRSTEAYRMVPVRKKVWVEEEYTVNETRTEVEQELRTKVIKPNSPRLARVKTAYGVNLETYRERPREKTYVKPVKVKYSVPVTKTRKVAKEIEEYQMVSEKRARRR